MNHIKLCRELAHLSQNELGSFLGVSQNTVSAWENETYCPSAYCIICMSYLFSVSPEFLLDGFHRFRFDELRMKIIPFVLPLDPYQYKE